LLAHTRQFCTFLLQDYLFGIPVTSVQEVVHHQVITRVPLVSDIVGGLMNLRGQILMVIDLRRRLQMDKRPPNLPLSNVIVRTDDGLVGLLVDSIGDVVEVHDCDFENSPIALASSESGLLVGVYKLACGLMHVLDPIKACDLSETRDSLEESCSTK